jgi:hypothetical protein
VSHINFILHRRRFRVCGGVRCAQFTTVKKFIENMHMIRFQLASLCKRLIIEAVNDGVWRREIFELISRDHLLSRDVVRF